INNSQFDEEPKKQVLHEARWNGIQNENMFRDLAKDLIATMNIENFNRYKIQILEAF
ncbi:1039_t:CDS:2, partial [Funneliformis geosporum]